jgi:MerR family transcriptional regulator, light-induced transcriptional regulator
MSTADQPQLPLRSVVARTGLSEHRLRAWERRYAAIHPSRTEGGQRRYSEADVDRLRLLRDLVSAGRSIGSIANLSTESLRELAIEDGPWVEAGRPAPSLEREILEALGAVENRDPGALYDLLSRSAVRKPSLEFVEGLLVPLLRRIGSMWRDGILRVGEEHLASQVVRDLAGQLLRTATVPGPVLLCTTPSGQRHEFGSLLAALAGSGAGWRSLYAGPDLPTSEIRSLASRVGARAVALSILHPGAEQDVEASLRALRRALPTDIDLLVGGPREVEAAATRVDGVDFLSSYRALAAFLESRSVVTSGGPEASPRHIRTGGEA